MGTYNINVNVVRALSSPSTKSAIQMNSSTEEESKLRKVLEKDVFSQPTSSIFFFGRIMSEALEGHDRKLSIESRTVINLGFADGIDALADREKELQTFVESLDNLHKV